MVWFRAKTCSLLYQALPFPGALAIYLVVSQYPAAACRLLQRWLAAGLDVIEGGGGGLNGYSRPRLTIYSLKRGLSFFYSQSYRIRKEVS